MSGQILFILWAVGMAVIVVGLRVTKKYDHDTDGAGFFGTLGLMVFWPLWLVFVLLAWGFLVITDNENSEKQ